MAVAKSTLGTFKTSVAIIHLKAITEGYPTTLVSNGFTLNLTSNGWPYSLGGTSQGCIDIWNASMDSSQSIVPWTGAIVEEWSSFNYLSTCLYVFQNGAAYDGSTTPGFQYWHRDHPNPSFGIFAGDFVPINME